MSKYELIATTPMGLEAVLARELKNLGYHDQLVENGRVTFYGTEKDICITNMWLRTAGRILIKMGEFEARTFEQLFEGTKALAWPDWIPEDGEFPVDGRSHKSQLSSVPACQGIVKKAIVEKMKERYNTEWFQETGARYVAEVTLLNDIATLTLDTTGAGLHKRGYRIETTEAPLRESLAAAMILLSRWRPERPLYDPFCGSGTILIEAALIGFNIAPGLHRSYNSEAWSRIGPAIWEEAREEAFDLMKEDTPLNLVGTDIDRGAIQTALANVRNAGLSKEIKLDVMPVSDIRPDGDYGCIITNPPYGERIGTETEVERLTQQLGQISKQLNNWSHFIITPDKTFETRFGRKADKKRKLFNGQIECTYYQYFGPLPPR
ncbi:THUMP domain-containing class I SAM-dependent RNA methyltransferase [Cohnella abietis]|uniref:RNA methyltransferase n=1 Tax=Cohnella abietis TaxID=2507935 RepID=A0A3T1CYB0_9BACL|nr:class I SAM-dependent RNA methyltransferase [Cohnella abietis]BBI30826.1 RNA methyltransferase [Cohnella abietis]